MIEFGNLMEVMAEYGKAMETKYKEELENSGRKASGRLISSINSNVTVDGMTYAIDFSLEDYWKYVENGTKPHFPPVSKILEWVKIKPILPTPDSSGKVPTPEQLAFLISRKISIYGTDGTKDLEDTLELTDMEWRDRITEALDKDVVEALNLLF